MAIPAFVIGLKRASSYYEQTIERLKSVGIDATFWEGVDKENLNLNEDESVRNWWSYIYHGKTLNPGAIGCYMAHYRLLKHIYQQGYERAIIFEDDAVPNPHLAASALDKLETLPSSYGIVQFSYSPASITDAKNSKCVLSIPEFNLYQIHNPTALTSAYMLHRNAIERLLPQIMPMLKPIDVFLFKPWRTGIDVYVASVNLHPLFSVDPDKISLIYGKQTRREKIKATVIKKFLTPIHHYRRKINRRKVARYRESNQ